MATHYDVLPIPAQLDFTHMIPAGSIQFGVEYRLLNEEAIAEEYGGDARAKFGNAPPVELGDQIDEDGVSLHVFGAEDGQEYLRFDCFDEYPHYHYLNPVAGHQDVHVFDIAAHGAMHAWVIDCLSQRLPEMLAQAGAEKLAQSVDGGKVASALEDVAREIENARRAGRPIPSTSSPQG
jgi:hypothetical protein